MLSLKAAKAELETFLEARESAWGDNNERFGDRITKLPTKLREFAYRLARLTNDDDDDSLDYEERSAANQKQMLAFDKLPQASRLKILKLFFGDLAPQIELTWNWLTTATFTDYEFEFPFRSPKDRTASLNYRVQWLHEMISLAGFVKDKTLTVQWLAIWGGHLTIDHRQFQTEIGLLCAAIIDKGPKKLADSVFEILMQSLNKEHEIGTMGRHIIVGFLAADRPEGWEAIEKLLMAAQRQEGLRQSILESATQAHPTAFTRLLELLIKQKLLRFSSVVQAMDQWFGVQWSSMAAKILNDNARQVLSCLQAPTHRKKILSSEDANAVYHALWAEAFLDIEKSVKVAAKLLKHKSVEIRFVAAVHLRHANSPSANAARMTAVGDTDLRVACAALFGSTTSSCYGAEIESEKWFDALEGLINKLSKPKQKMAAIVWPWTDGTIQRSDIASLLWTVLGKRPLRCMLPYVEFLEPWERGRFVAELGEQKKWDSETRQQMLQYVGDRNGEVSEEAVKGLQKHKLKTTEATQLEAFLTRTGATMRKGVIQLLLTLDDAAVLASAERLLSAAKEQRLAGLELLRQLCENNRSRMDAIEVAAQWSDGRKLLKAEKGQVDAILNSDHEILSLNDGLGLFDPAKRSKTIAPTNRKVNAYTPTVLKVLKSIDDLIHKNRQLSVTYRSWQKEETDLLGNIGWSFPSPNVSRPAEKEKKRLPVPELWEEWLQSRSKTLLDKDGFELVRAQLFIDGHSYQYHQLKTWAKKDKGYAKLCKFLGADQKCPNLRYQHMVEDVLKWLIYLHPPKATCDFKLDVLETAYSMIPADALKKLLEPAADEDQYYDDDKIGDWRELYALQVWTPGVTDLPNPKPTSLVKRMWNLEHWRDEPISGAHRRRPDLDLLIAAYEQKLANLDDVADQLFASNDHRSWGRFTSISSITQRPVPPGYLQFSQKPEIATLVNSIRSKVLELELERGETATVVSELSLEISSFEGMAALLDILKAIGKTGFKKLRTYNAKTHDNRAATLTQLASNTYPNSSDTPQAFAKLANQAVAAGDFPEERLLQLAFLAPQWIPLVEAAVDWNGLSDGILWYMAHMGHIWELTAAFEDEQNEDEDLDNEELDDKDDEREQTPKPEKLSRFERLIREQTSLTRDERENGAIDVPWFHRTYEKLSPERFDALAAAARFATTTQAAKKAQYVADVLLGNIPKSELVEAIEKKNLKEKVRLLGLLPLDKKKTQADILDRYEVLQSYLRYAKKLSSMSRPDALQSYEIGMQNLASTAGFDDPIRLQWTLEAASTKDLAAGPVVVQKDDVSLTLELDQDAKPFLTIRRGDKELKSLPKKVNKEPEFVELRERNKQLKRQVSRVKEALELAMVRQDTFTGAELMELSDHALLWPQLSRLILVGQGIMGYPVKAGKGLIDHSGKIEPVKKKETLRIAHPHDLLKSKAWSKWQKDCFQQERLQPFKQVFRELYVVTAQEKKDKTSSARYAAQQVNPRQAFALWGRQGWSVDEYGDVFKAFPNQDLVVSVSFNHGYTTPLEVEGLTIENVHFRSRDSYKPLPVTKVDPIMFSEIMRDMDLVVSVAHVGEVDPETSASTVEMRSSLLKETCQLLGLKNVKLKNNHAMIKGSLAQYTVHLGSGVVHCQPGGAVCLVPVHSQHRGRLFLPFADDDPRTAEVISKTLLLAKDEEIQDPIILDQLRAMA